MKNQTENENEKDQTSMLIEKLVEVTTENNILRGTNKHIIRLGVVSLELIPITKMKLSEVFSEFTQFAKTMKKLHGNEHLKATIVHSTEEEAAPELNTEMFN